jgi:ABC-type Fe3+ transport system substrate-binding protein
LTIVQEISKSEKGKRMTTRRPILLIVIAWSVFLLFNNGESATPGDWEQTLVKAKQEGQVVLGSGIGIPAFRQNVVRVFAKRFGFDVEIRVLEGAELTTVVGRECGAGRPSNDVLLGGLSELISVYPKGCLSPAKPRLVLDEVVNPQNWKGGLLKWSDPEGQFFLQTSDQVYGSLIINSKLIRPHEITSMKDLLRPQYAGKIASYDPRKSGAGQSDATYWYAALGEDFVKRLFVDQKVVYTSDHRQLAEWIARGVYLVGLGSVDRNVEPLRQEGLPIGIIPTLTDAPGYITGGSSVLKLVKDSPHPSGATVLFNWLASKEGQEIFSQATGHPSRRVDVGSKGVPSHRIPNPGTDYLDTYTYEFYSKKRPEISKKLTELLGR